MQNQPVVRIQPDIRILKEATCPSLTGRSNLTYHIGCIGEAIQLRVFMNSGTGYFSQEWIPFARISEIVEGSLALTSRTLTPIFTGKSVNTAGFVMAVLKDLGLIEAVPGNQRRYQATENEAFIEAVKTLIASDVSLEIAEPKKPAKNAVKIAAKSAKEKPAKSADSLAEPSSSASSPASAPRKGTPVTTPKHRKQ